jgi:hypothetical protein
MANYLALLTGGAPNPEMLASTVVTIPSTEPTKCFPPIILTASRDNSLTTTIPQLELIHSLHLRALGQEDNLHRHLFVFVVKTIGKESAALHLFFMESVASIAASVDRQRECAAWD